MTALLTRADEESVWPDPVEALRPPSDREATLLGRPMPDDRLFEHLVHLRHQAAGGVALHLDAAALERVWRRPLADAVSLPTRP